MTFLIQAHEWVRLLDKLIPLLSSAGIQKIIKKLALLCYKLDNFSEGPLHVFWGGGVGWGGWKVIVEIIQISTIIIVLFSDLFVMSQTCKLVLGKVFCPFWIKLSIYLSILRFSHKCFNNQRLLIVKQILLVRILRNVKKIAIRMEYWC